MSDLGNITGLSVFETVGDLDGHPCSSGGSHECGELSVLLGFPGSVLSLLVSNEGGESCLLLNLGSIAGGEGSLGVGIEVSLSSDNEGFVFGLEGDELGLEVSVDSSASLISSGSGGGEGLVEGVLRPLLRPSLSPLVDLQHGSGPQRRMPIESHTFCPPLPPR